MCKPSYGVIKLHATVLEEGIRIDCIPNLWIVYVYNKNLFFLPRISIEMYYLLEIYFFNIYLYYFTLSLIL